MPLALKLGQALVGRGAIGGRRQKHPVAGDDLDFFLGHQAGKIQRLEACQRAIAVGIRQRTPLHADVGERRRLGRPQRRHLLRRQQLDLVGLDLLRQTNALAGAEAVELDVAEQAQVGEQKKEDQRSHQGLFTLNACQAGSRRDAAIIHDRHRRPEARELLANAGPVTAGAARPRR